MNEAGPSPGEKGAGWGDGIARDTSPGRQLTPAPFSPGPRARLIYLTDPGYRWVPGYPWKSTGR